jgi:Carbohydrate-binding family 9
MPGQTPIHLPEITAAHTDGGLILNAGAPAPEWRAATPITFCADWQGKNPDPTRETQVRVLWSREKLYLRFQCRYQGLNVFEDSQANGRRDYLWERDVAEVFLQPDPAREGHYCEFEISPNGMWIDLEISPGGSRADLKSGLQRSVGVDENSKIWAAELAIPMTALTNHFAPALDSTVAWRANFYRVEGATEPRSYFAWQPTHTLQPDFHVPKVFGSLRFAAAGAH